MAYTTLAAVQDEFKSLVFSASSTPTTTQVTEFIVQEEATLDARISKRYTVPVTAGTGALSIMKRLATLLVKARILDRNEVKTGNQDTDQGAPGDRLRKQVDDMLGGILDGSVNFAGATLAEVGGGVVDYNSRNDVTPTFERNTTQW